MEDDYGFTNVTWFNRFPVRGGRPSRRETLFDDRRSLGVGFDLARAYATPQMRDLVVFVAHLVRYYPDEVRRLFAAPSSFRAHCKRGCTTLHQMHTSSRGRC